MNNILAFEELMLNASPVTSRNFYRGFILNYNGLTPFTNSVHAIYAKNDEDLRYAVEGINRRLLSGGKVPMYRIIGLKEYKELDRILFRINFDKILPFLVISCSLKNFSDKLFKFASFYENGVFIDKNITIDSQKWLDDYFYLEGMNRGEQDVFLDMLSMTECPRYAFTLIQENTLIGCAYATRHDRALVLHEIIINEKYRGLGYSSKLLMSILTLALREDCQIMIAQIPDESIGKGRLTGGLFTEEFFDVLYGGYYRAEIKNI